MKSVTFRCFSAAIIYISMHFLTIDGSVIENGRYVGTSGTQRTCTQHADCYNLREPNEWCPLPPGDRYYEKGCFCDTTRSLCTIEREGTNGPEYTDCIDKSYSRCEVNGGRTLQDLPVVNNPVQAGDDRTLSPSSIYVSSSGERKSCTMHENCYDMREPSEWCPLPTSDRYYDKGCFCDHTSSRCVIERQTPGGSEYTDCAYKSNFQCVGSRSQLYDVQPPMAVSEYRGNDQSKYIPGDVVPMTVTPGGQYVRTTGRTKTCNHHEDCYQMREPNEWCPLPSADQYYDKGCFCDYIRNECTIERQIPGGSEYTDCTDYTSFTCGV